MPFHDLNAIPKRRMLPGIDARFVHGENMTLSYWNLEPGAAIPPHSHPHEQITTVISGEMEMTVAGETRVLGPGSVVTIAPNAEHSVRAVAECYVTDSFYPVREDYR